MEHFVTNIVIFVVSVFLGVELIQKVPTTLHTPLMSGSNAISGITLVGAMICSFNDSFARFGVMLGFLAVVFAMINVVGGYAVTHRMLQMFKPKATTPAEQNPPPRQ